MPKIRDVIGHDAQVRELQQHIDGGNVSHAYLFAGPKHVGKMTTAFWFANALLSADVPPERHDAIRHQIENLTHPDLLVLDRLWIDKECDNWDVLAQYSNVPQAHRSKKSSPARTDTISIDDIRALQERLHETSVGVRRCCIIRSVERMQDTAANALLKILEEPPTGLTFLLTTQSTASLLPTILSRTRTVRFTRLAYRDMRQFVAGADDNDTSFILRLAQGAPGVAKHMATDPDALREAKQLYNSAVRFWETDSLRERLKMLEPLRQRGREADDVLLHITLAMRSQPVDVRTRNTAALLHFLRGLRTNANPQLVSQQFALAIQ